MSRNMNAVILTGAAGGVGMDACKALADKGYRVYAGAIDPWEMSELESLIRAQNLRTVMAVMLDLRKHEQIAAVAARLHADGYSLAGLVLNGAASPQGVPIEHTPPELLRDTFETNVIGNYAAVRTCLPLLKASKGRIIFVSSASTYAPPPLELPYVATKCAINGMADSMRREFRNLGIKVSVLVPGIIKRTYMAHGLHEGTKRRLAEIRGCSPEEVHAAKYDPGQNTALMQPEGGADPFYEGMLQGQMNTIGGGLETGFEPSVVTAHIVAALEARKPRAIYVEGIFAKVFRVLAWLIPVTWMDRVVVRIGYQ